MKSEQSLSEELKSITLKSWLLVNMAGLCDYPDQLEVEESVCEGTYGDELVFTVTCDPRDIRFLVGKDGKHFKAFQTLLVPYSKKLTKFNTVRLLPIVRRSGSASRL